MDPKSDRSKKRRRRGAQRRSTETSKQVVRGAEEIRYELERRVKFEELRLKRQLLAQSRNRELLTSTITAIATFAGMTAVLVEIGFSDALKAVTGDGLHDLARWLSIVLAVLAAVVGFFAGRSRHQQGERDGA